MATIARVVHALTRDEDGETGADPRVHFRVVQWSVFDETATDSGRSWWHSWNLGQGWIPDIHDMKLGRR